MIAAHVVEPARPASACSPRPARAGRAPGAYAFVVEPVREGYLCHYGEPRLLAGLDPDLGCSPATTSTRAGSSGWRALGDLPRRVSAVWPS